MIKPTRIFAMALVLLTLVFSSCKKEGASNPKYYIKFKMDGNWKTWTTALGELGPDFADDRLTNLGITGFSDDNNQRIDLTIQVSGPNLGTGVYKSDDYLMPVFYIENTPELKFYTQRDEGGIDDSKYTITITSITNETISGHFTGNYLENSMEENDFIEITEGQFVVKRVR